MAEARAPTSKRRAARYAAVQALYQIELSSRLATQVVAEFETYRLDDLFQRGETGAAPPAVDRALFRRIVLGAEARRAELDEAIAQVLAEDWTLERIGFTLRAMLRAGAFELARMPETDIATVITEYVQLAQGFFEGREPAFVNAVLDKLARALREPPTSLAELAAMDPGDKT